MQKKMDQFTQEEIFWLIAMLNPNMVEAVYKGSHIEFERSAAGALRCKPITQDEDRSSCVILTNLSPRSLNYPDGWLYHEGMITGSIYGSKHAEKFSIHVLKRNGEHWLL